VADSKGGLAVNGFDAEGPPVFANIVISLRTENHRSDVFGETSGWSFGAAVVGEEEAVPGDENFSALAFIEVADDLADSVREVVSFVVEGFGVVFVLVVDFEAELGVGFEVELIEIEDGAVRGFLVAPAGDAFVESCFLGIFPGPNGIRGRAGFDEFGDGLWRRLGATAGEGGGESDNR